MLLGVLTPILWLIALVAALLIEVLWGNGPTTLDIVASTIYALICAYFILRALLKGKLK